MALQFSVYLVQEVYGELSESLDNVLSIQYAIANILIICYDYKRRIISIESLESLFWAPKV